MDFRLGRAFVEFFVDGKAFDAGMKRTRAALESMKDAMAGASRTIRNWLLAGGALAGWFIHEWMKAEDATMALDQALIATGQNAAVWGPMLQKAAAGIQAVTRYSDEAVMAAMKMALHMGISTSATEAWTKRAIGLSTVLGLDLEQAMKMLMEAEFGQFTMLQRFMPQLRGAANEVAKLAMVNDLATKGWASAQAMTKTAAGELAVLKNRVSDLGERLGKALMPAFRTMTGWLQRVTEWFERMGDDGIQRLMDRLLALGAVLATVWATTKIIAGAIAVHKTIVTIVAVMRTLHAVSVSAMAGLGGALAAIGAAFVAAAIAIDAAITKEKALGRALEQRTLKQAELIAREKVLQGVLKGPGGAEDKLEAARELVEVQKRLLDLNEEQRRASHDKSWYTPENADVSKDAEAMASKYKAMYDARLANTRQILVGLEQEQGKQQLVLNTEQKILETKQKEKAEFIGLADYWKKMAAGGITAEARLAAEQVSLQKQQLEEAKKTRKLLEKAAGRPGGVTVEMGD